jgi:pimeloyl-ACP methyl ester carboxylesterase
MATFVLIHGAGDGGWYWHLVEPELRALGHDVVAPDLPAGDDTAHLADYVDVVAAAVGDRRDLVVVGQSFGGITAPLVVDRLAAGGLVFVAGMIPVPGEAPADWWAGAGYRQAVAEQAARDGGLTGNDDPFVSFFHDVPRPLAEESLRRERNHPCGHLDEPWPLPALPDVPTRFVLGTEDRFFPPALLRRLVADRLPGVTPDEIPAGHCCALSRPAELARLLHGHTAGSGAPAGPGGRA